MLHCTESLMASWVTSCLASPWDWNPVKDCLCLFFLTLSTLRKLLVASVCYHMKKKKTLNSLHMRNCGHFGNMWALNFQEFWLSRILHLSLQSPASPSNLENISGLQWVAVTYYVYCQLWDYLVQCLAQIQTQLFIYPLLYIQANRFN